MAAGQRTADHKTIGHTRIEKNTVVTTVRRNSDIVIDFPWHLNDTAL